MAARVVDAAFALIYLRLLGRTDVGAYQSLVVFTTYLDTLIDFGLNALLAREVSRGSVSVSVAFRAVNRLRLGLWLIGLLPVAVIYGPLLPATGLPSEAAAAGWIFYLALLPAVLAKTATGVLWAAERLDVTAAVSVLSTLLRTALGAVVLFGGLGLGGLGVVSLTTNVVASVVLWRLAATGPLATTTTEANQPEKRATRGWLRESWPLFLNQMLQGLFFKVDAVLMPALAGSAAAGVYAAAYKVSEGAGIVSSSFTLAVFPRLARANQSAGAYAMALRLLFQIGFPLAAGIGLLAQPIVGVVGGRDYLPDSAIALAILICYLPLSYANGLTQYVLIAAGRQRLLTGAFFAALIFNVAANVMLIPRFSYGGAAWVTVASEVVLLVPFQLAARKLAPQVSLTREARAPLAATLLMAPVVWWLRDSLHPLAAAAAGAAVYALALWALGGIDHAQRRLIAQVVR